jgi:hypothetical protein
MNKESIQTSGDREVVLMDSITSAGPQDVGKVVVAGSHGGVSSGEFATRHLLGACFLNDAGVGKDGAGIIALRMLDAVGVPGGTISNHSARIGDARDHWDNGVLSHVNQAASAVGLEAGMSVQNAVARLG